MDTISKSFKGIAGYLGLTDGDAAVETNDPSHAPQLPETLPWVSRSTSPDPDSLDIFQNEPLPNTTRSRLEHQPDTTTKRRNSEAVRAPDPKLGYQCHTMVKPGQGLGYQPVNTLNVNASGASKSSSKRYTYSKTGRKPSSREGFPGADNYRSQHPDHPVATSPTYVVPDSPRKRRKLGNISAALVPTVEIHDDDEVVSPARQASTPRARSTISSGSPRSTVSKYSGIEMKGVSQPTSEFRNTDMMFDARRNTKHKPRKPRSKGPSDHRRESPPEVSFVGARTSPRELSFSEVDDDIKPPRTARSSILSSHEQGVDRLSSRREAQHSPEVISKHFPIHSPNTTMRIIESTKAETAARKRNGGYPDPARWSSPSKNLRDHRFAEHGAGVLGDPIENSDDELAETNAFTSVPRRRQSPAKAGRKGGSSRQHGDAVGVCYRLKYARSYDLNVCSTDLQLRQDKEKPKRFRITNLDSEGNIKTLAIVDLTLVNKYESDNINRIRLMGGANTDGDRYWFDLQFNHPLEFMVWRETYVQPECGSRRRVTTDDIMAVLFQKPLQRNDKVGKSPMVSEESPAGSVRDGQQTSVKPKLLGTLMNSAGESNQSTTSVRGEARQLSRAIQAPQRAVRNTRATAPLFDRDVHEEKEVEKYSVVHGLGRIWAKPLDYSVDRGFLKRRKATLNYGDLEKLDEGEFLNDSIMTFYMLYLYDELKVSIDRVYFFNTYFFPTLTRKVKGREGINYDDVKSWTKRDDVFSYDYIVVPINENLHWYLAIICNVANINRTFAVEDSQEESRDPQQTTTSLETPEIHPNLKPNSNLNMDPERQGDIVVTPEVNPDKEVVDHDDVNLFEEEKLDLIDRDAELAGNVKQPAEEQDALGKETIRDEVTAPSIPAQSDPAAPALHPAQAKQAPKKKAKLKPGPQKKDPDKPVIMILDSLSATHSNATRALREWLQAEGLEKRAMTVEIDNKAHYPKASQIPMQTNFSDCGLYVLGYLRKFFADPDQFRVKLLQQEMSAQSDWPDMNPSKMRGDIRSLIFRLNEERNGARKEVHRAKRTATSVEAQVLPTQSGSGEASPAVRQSDVDETADATAVPAAIEAEVAPNASLAEVPIPSTAAAPRLRSPFKEAQSKESTRTILGGAQKLHTLSPVKGISNNSTKSSPVRQRQSPAIRTKSPEVRISVKSPHIDRSTHLRCDGARDSAKQPTEQSTDLTSPLQNLDQRNRNDGKLRMPSAKKAHASSPPQHERRKPSSPLRTRSGSHDDPITLDDSQDLDAPVRTHPQPRETITVDDSQDSIQVTRLPDNDDAQTSPTKHHRVLELEDSLQEGAGYEWQEQHDITRALKLSLRDEEERRERLRGMERNQEMKDVFDAQAVYSQFSQTVVGLQDVKDPQDHQRENEGREVMEMQPMDIDTHNENDNENDDVVPESPAHRISSPALDVEMLG